MDKILNAIKCAICHEVLESPVILPCNDPICKKHVSNQVKDVIRCEKCGVENHIPKNGFQPLPFLEEIIKSEIGHLDFGSVHNKAKKSCKSVEESLKELDTLLKDPYVFAHEKITELKNTVHLKGEELKLIIDQEVKKLIDKLDEYERQSKEYLSSNELNIETKRLESELKLSQSNLDSWIKSLNK